MLRENYGSPRQEEALPLITCQLSEIAKTSLTHGVIKSAFEIEEGCSDTADYLCLWHVDATNQLTMVVSPDSHGRPRPNAREKVKKILALNGRVHYNECLRFDANSLAVMFTERDAIGVNKIPNVVFQDRRYEYVWTLWGNSTLGLLCHWMCSGKQTSGRGQNSRSALRSMLTLDVRQLNPLQLTIAEAIFHELKSREMLAFSKMVDDPVRQQLDRLLLSKVFGFEEDTHPEVHEGVDLLRKKLCAEPSIDGGKQ